MVRRRGLPYIAAGHIVFPAGESRHKDAKAGAISCKALDDSRTAKATDLAPPAPLLPLASRTVDFHGAAVARGAAFASDRRGAEPQSEGGALTIALLRDSPGPERKRLSLVDLARSFKRRTMRPDGTETMDACRSRWRHLQ